MKEQKLKTIIAEAMYAGGLLAEQKYGGLMNSNTYEPVVHSLTKLVHLLEDLTTEEGLTGISIEKVLPLYKEIETVTKFD